MQLCCMHICTDAHLPSCYTHESGVIDFILLCKASRISGCGIYTPFKSIMYCNGSVQLYSVHGCCDSHQNASTGVLKVTSYMDQITT